MVHGVLHVHLRVDAHGLELVVYISNATVQGDGVLHALPMTVHRVVARQVIGSASVLRLG